MGSEHEQEIVDNIDSLSGKLLINVQYRVGVLQYTGLHHFDFDMQKKKMRIKKKIGIKMLTDYNFDVDEESEQRFIEEYGANITIQLRDGR